MLHGSDDYDFIHVEENGYVVSYAPRRSSGDHHHLMYIRAETTFDVYFPIAIKVQHGTISVSVSISRYLKLKKSMQINNKCISQFSQVVHQTETLEIEIIGEASKVHRHTSAMLDVKTRANEIEFFNIIVDESPIIPYEIYRRYVAGSPSGSMTITGDTVGENFCF